MDEGKLHNDYTYRIMGACFEVYKEKGCGFLEPVYQECLDIEFRLQGIPAESLKQLNLDYKGHALKKTYEADFICLGSVLIELKAVSELTDKHRSQVINYLKATGLKVALLINFGHHPGLEYERFVNTVPA